MISEVLPSIRKHGLYIIDDILTNPDIAITALQKLKEERDKRQQLENTITVQTQQIVEMKSKASYYDVVLNGKDLVVISVIAKDHGWSARRMNTWLHEKGILLRQPSGIWLLYQQYDSKCYTSTKTKTFVGTDGETNTTHLRLLDTSQGALHLRTDKSRRQSPEHREIDHSHPTSVEKQRWGFPLSPVGSR